MVSPTFVVGKNYSRPEIFEALGLSGDLAGGNWFTGYNEHDDEFYLFVNVGSEGRTGHDYHNRWDGPRLTWSAKTDTTLAQPQIQRLLARGRRVHVFWRDDNRAPFIYAGLATPAQVIDTSPVGVVWEFNQERSWRDAVLAGLRRFAERHSTALITRQGLLTEELPQIESDVDTKGVTPSQTLSRVLQELRDEGLIEFLGDGSYILLEDEIPIDREDLPSDAIEAAIRATKLSFGGVDTSDQLATTRRRRGQDKLRELTLSNYSSRCAFCGVTDPAMLIAAHIVRWADDPETRGDLANLICMCRLHDILFEHGFFSLSDNHRILARTYLSDDAVRVLLDSLRAFRAPLTSPPDPRYLRRHRQRSGLES